MAPYLNATRLPNGLSPGRNRRIQAEFTVPICGREVFSYGRLFVCLEMHKPSESCYSFSARSSSWEAFEE